MNKELTPLQAYVKIKRYELTTNKYTIGNLLQGVKELKECDTIIETALKENKTLKKLYKMELKNTSYYNNLALKYKRAVEIIRNKGIDILEFRATKKAKTYNENTKRVYVEDYTDEEYDFLKEMLKDE